jgi:peptidoglycan-associated lipoprotein
MIVVGKTLQSMVEQEHLSARSRLRLAWRIAAPIVLAGALVTMTACKLREGIPFWKFWQTKPSAETAEAKPQQAPKIEPPCTAEPPPGLLTAVPPPLRSGALHPTEHLRTVYFDYDSAALTGEAQKILSENALWLRERANIEVQIEGHCDERGTVEYNFNLGQRRADAVRDFLISQGISPNILHTISFGEERPVDPAHNEDAWRKNRRVQFLVYEK